MSREQFQNPFKPGAGHRPPYLAGRDAEIDQFRQLLEQNVILKNLVITGLRGVGKTVLMDELKPIAIQKGWLWVGTDLSESASLSEERIAIRLLTDLASATSGLTLNLGDRQSVGFHRESVSHRLDFNTLRAVFDQTPGLVADKLKAVLQLAASSLRTIAGFKGVIFAYDEAQNMADHGSGEQYPLSLMLDTYQSIQRQDIPFMLVLAGLPTLFPKLVEARTYAERMFEVMFLDRLNAEDSRMAILKPIENCPAQFSESGVDMICSASGGYPYFIQFFCHEAYDSYLQQYEFNLDYPNVRIDDITRKLDSAFFAGRWARATDRQRELLYVASLVQVDDGEFTPQEVAAKTKEVLAKPISPSQISQMFSTLSDAGLIYKNRHGKYAFAVPLLGRFIRRNWQQR